MNITTRYADIPDVAIDPGKIPPEFHHLIALAKEWGIVSEDELESYIALMPEKNKREFVEAFTPHFDALWKWHRSCEHKVPQPDELVLFDFAANSAATVATSLK